MTAPQHNATPEPITPQPSTRVCLYTDGGCSGNPGPGGWAYVLESPASGAAKQGSGGEPETTNNRMELQGVIEGLKALKRACQVRVVTDSQYVVRGMREWLLGWKANGWRRRVGRHLKPLANEDLWRELDELAAGHDIEFEHVRGHRGHPQNERCDQLAVAAYQKYL
jgi:ribonuclease HI